MRGVKQVPTLEYNPLKRSRTTFLAAKNIIKRCHRPEGRGKCGAEYDKAVNPIQSLWCSKLCRKNFCGSNAYSGNVKDTVQALFRYGNVVGSRGSVIPFFMRFAGFRRLSDTDKRMIDFSNA